MDRRESFQYLGALFGIAIAPKIALSNMFPQEQDKDTELETVIKTLDELNRAFYDSAIENEGNLKKNIMENKKLVTQHINELLRNISKNSIIYSKAQELNENEDMRPARVKYTLNFLFKDYFNKHDMYFRAGNRAQGEAIVLDMRIFRYAPRKEVEDKYGFSTLQYDEPLNVYEKDVSSETVLLGEALLTKIGERRGGTLGWVDRDRIIINTERLDEKVNREYKEYYQKKSENPFIFLKSKAWEDFDGLSEKEAKRKRGQRLLESIRYHESTHLLIKRESGIETYDAGKDYEAHLHDEAICNLTELIYGREQLSKLADIWQSAQRYPGFERNIGDIILGGFNQYYEENRNRFLGGDVYEITIGDKSYKLPKSMLTKEKIKEMAQYTMDLYFKDAFKN